jgi:hypothetical protein
MSTKTIPPHDTIQALAKYANILAAASPDSPAAQRFFEENCRLEQFEENARCLYQMEKEDYEERKYLISGSGAAWCAAGGDCRPPGRYS